MHTNRFWELIAKQLAGEITPDELQELNYLKGEDEFLSYNDELIQSVSALTFSTKDSVSGDELQKKWSSLQQKIDTNTISAEASPAKAFRMMKLLKYATVAASFALLIVFGYKWLNQSVAEKIITPNIVSTKNGSRTKIQMPDGTQIWLNGGSSLKYNNDTYGETLREVELVGEAYFDVTKDTAHPFIIHTKAMDIKVVGTAFNIRAYPNEKQTETALIRGAIEVSFPNRPSEKLFLKPNEKITVSNNELVADPSKKQEVVQVDPSAPIIILSPISFEPFDSTVVETSWLRNKLVFRSKSFEELARDMERWYNISIRFQDSSLADRHFTGTFQNETFLEALDYLKLSSPFQYTYSKDSNTVTLSQVTSHTKK